MWSIKKEDLVMKERLSKMKLLESLIAKQVPLADYEEALKKKLIDGLMSNGRVLGLVVWDGRVLVLVALYLVTSERITGEEGYASAWSFVQREIISRLVIISVLSCGNQSVTGLGL
ncbi:hypothetical protein DY000_02050420 [Brassica cretica]|uniref:Uncharacterized protein n=1 Tax=Brassica cretica TaxID=69181 RepID=A0ABQ7F3U0_BRACR|nr:hypothetical protein DY000_02050420 [Brassica cretica]